MAKKFSLLSDASFSKKFAIYDSNEQSVANVKVNGVADFFNIFFGWLISLPENFDFSYLTDDITVKSTTKVLGSKYEILINNELMAQVQKKRRSNGFASDIEVTINEQPLHFTSQNGSNYFSLMQNDKKIIVAKRGLKDIDKFSVILDDEVNPGLGLGIVMAIINSYKK